MVIQSQFTSFLKVLVKAKFNEGQVRVLVCGDRKYSNYIRVKQALQAVKPTLVIEGEAKGADSLGREAAEYLGIPVMKFPAQWDSYGRAAGPIRNKQMLEEGKPDLVLAFHTNIAESKGTKNMIKIAKEAGIKVILIED